MSGPRNLTTARCSTQQKGVTVCRVSSSSGIEGLLAALSPEPDARWEGLAVRFAAFQPQIPPTWQKHQIGCGRAMNPHPGPTVAESEFKGIIRSRPAVPIFLGRDRTRTELDRLAILNDRLDPLECDGHSKHGGVECATDGGTAIVRSPLKARCIVRGDATRNRVRPAQDPAGRGSRSDPAKHDDRPPSRHGWNISGLFKPTHYPDLRGIDLRTERRYPVSSRRCHWHLLRVGNISRGVL